MSSLPAAGRQAKKKTGQEIYTGDFAYAGEQRKALLPPSK
jgi:hypothetical protein